MISSSLLNHDKRQPHRFCWACLAYCLLLLAPAVSSSQQTDRPKLAFEPLPNLPDEIGVAGPIAGACSDVLIVAGGANFGKADDPDLWDMAKKYHRSAWLLHRELKDSETHFWWEQAEGFQLNETSIESLGESLYI